MIIVVSMVGVATIAWGVYAPLMRLGNVNDNGRTNLDIYGSFDTWPREEVNW